VCANRTTANEFKADEDAQAALVDTVTDLTPQITAVVPITIKTKKRGGSRASTSVPGSLVEVGLRISVSLFLSLWRRGRSHMLPSLSLLQFNSNYGTSEALVASFKRTLAQEFSGNATDCSFARAYAANLAAQGGWSAPCRNACDVACA
jgi:hypothetical protein